MVMASSLLAGLPAAVPKLPDRQVRRGSAARLVLKLPLLAPIPAAVQLAVKRGLVRWM